MVKLIVFHFNTKKPSGFSFEIGSSFLYGITTVVMVQTFCNFLAGNTIWIITVIIQFVLAVSASFRQVRMFRREDFLLLAGVLAPAHLHGGAAASPAVGRIVLVPELVGWRQRDAVEGGVFGVAGRCPTSASSVSSEKGS